MFKQLKFLNDEESKLVYDSVYKLEQYWTHRSEDLSDLDDIPYYSLGASSYLDIIDPTNPEDVKRHQDLTAKMNPILWEEFHDLYKKLLIFIEESLGYKAIFHEGFALPGFHIFQSDILFESEFAPVHTDLHYTLLDWQGAKFDPQNNISYTIPLRLPKHGGGVYFWDQCYEAPEGLSFEEHRDKMYSQELDDSTKHYCSHKEGYAAIHSGNLYHQVAPYTDVQEDDERTTFQGHGVLIDDVYHLFW